MGRLVCSHQRIGVKPYSLFFLELRQKLLTEDNNQYVVQKPEKFLHSDILNENIINNNKNNLAMKFDISKREPIFGEDKRPAMLVDAETLKNSGVAFASYGIQEGDRIEFAEDEVQVFSQKTTTGGTQMLAICNRGKEGQPNTMRQGYVALGSLIRQDAVDRNKFVSPLAKELYNLGNNGNRASALVGKTIVAKGSEELNVTVFENGMPKRDGDNAIVTEKKSFAKIEYVK